MNQPNTNTEISAPESADLSAATAMINKRITSALDHFKRHIGIAVESANSSLQTSVYLGHYLSELKSKCFEKGYLEIDGEMIPSWKDYCAWLGIPLRTVDYWINLFNRLGKYLEVIDDDNGNLALKWSDDAPPELQNISAAKALKMVAEQPSDQDSPKLPQPAEKKPAIVFDHIVRVRGLLTRYLEGAPIVERTHQECFELAATLKPLAETYAAARERALEAEEYAGSL